MGIVFHKLCYEVMDARTKRLRKQRELQKKRPLRGKFMNEVKAEREIQLHGLVDEARVWMYAMSLNLEIIAGYDENIENDVDIIIFHLKDALLGRRIHPSRIKQVCGRIARNILVHGIEDLDDDYQHYFPRVRRNNPTRRALDNTFVKASTITKIYRECPNFQQNHPHVRTWNEVRAVAAPYSIRVNDDGMMVVRPLRDQLDIWQLQHAKMFLGFPNEVEWSWNMEAKVRRQLRSRKIPNPITEYDTYKNSDLIVVVPHHKSGNRRAAASMLRPKNIMRLYPRFFEGNRHMSLQNMNIRAGGNLKYDLDGCLVRYFLHEITHAVGVLETEDHTFQVTNGVLDFMPTLSMYPASREQGGPSVPGGNGHYLAYGLESCLGLARRDLLNRTNKAEDNADSWSFYFLLTMLIFVYPDLDFIEAFDTDNEFVEQRRRVRRRSHLLHHCTLFEPLRHERAGTIRDHPDYDSSKDYCGANSGRDRPTTVDEILMELKVLDHRYNFDT